MDIEMGQTIFLRFEWETESGARRENEVLARVVGTDKQRKMATLLLAQECGKKFPGYWVAVADPDSTGRTRPWATISDRPTVMRLATSEEVLAYDKDCEIYRRRNTVNLC